MMNQCVQPCSNAWRESNIKKTSITQVISIFVIVLIISCTIKSTLADDNFDPLSTYGSSDVAPDSSSDSSNDDPLGDDRGEVSTYQEIIPDVNKSDVTIDAPNSNDSSEIIDNDQKEDKDATANSDEDQSKQEASIDQEASSRSGLDDISTSSFRNDESSGEPDAGESRSGLRMGFDTGLGIDAFRKTMNLGLSGIASTHKNEALPRRQNSFLRQLGQRVCPVGCSCQCDPSSPKPSEVPISF